METAERMKRNAPAVIDSKWSIEQELYLEYLAAGKVDVNGVKYDKYEIAKMLNVGVTTLWRWERLDGFQGEVFDRSIKRLTEYLPSMNKAMVKQALEKGNVQAYMAVMRQANLLKADKTENKNDNVTEIKIVFDGS